MHHINNLREIAAQQSVSMDRESCVPPQERFEHPYHVELLNQDEQRQHGDNLPEGFQSTLPEQVNLDLRQNDLTELKRLWDTASFNRTEFFERFGDIGALIETEVDEELIRGILQFWDPSYRCFVFNECDMVPTLEEYAQLLRLEFKITGKIYLKGKKLGLTPKLAKILGVKKEELAAYRKRKNASEVITANFLMDFIRENPRNKSIGNVLALLIYGLVIFPKVIGHVEESVVDLVEQIMSNSNPVPAILAETIRSLNFCRINGRGRFHGCAQLLCIWCKSHLEELSIQFTVHYTDRRRPISEFNSGPLPVNKSKREWVEKLRNLTRNEVTWRAEWFHRTSVVYQCANQPWVPLIGLWGVISYCPVLVRSQYGSQQFVPATHGLTSVDFDYKEEGSRKRVEDLRKTLTEAKAVRPSQYENSVTEQYPEWHRQRVKDLRIPPPFEPTVQLGPEMEDLVAQMTIEIQRLKEGTSLQELEEKHRKLSEEKQNVEQQNEKLARELAKMKNKALAEASEKEVTRSSCLQLKTTLREQNKEICGLERRITGYQEDARWVRGRLKKEMSYAAERDSKVGELTVSLKRVREEARDKKQELEESVKRMENAVRIYKEAIKVNRGDTIQLEDMLKEMNHSYQLLLDEYHQGQSNSEAWANVAREKQGQVRFLLGHMGQGNMRTKAMSERAKELRTRLLPTDPYGQEMINFLEDVCNQYHQLMAFYKYAVPPM